MSGSAHAVLVELTDVVQLRAGTVHACVVTTGGGVQCWGSNRYGQLGDGTTTDRGSAYFVAGLSSGVLAVSPSSGASIGGFEGHTCAVMVAGGVKCWGLNFAGQLGDGTTTNRLTPVDVPGLAGPAVDVATGFDHTCALLQTGAVQCWGANASGQLGDGTTTPRPAPTNVTGLPSGAVEIAAGPRHTCVITPASDAKCWGANEKGQLGDGTTLMRSAPVDVSSLAGNTAAISPGGSLYQQDLTSSALRGGGHTCAITVSGGVKCWGANFTGQLGDGSFTDHLTPFDVVGLTSGVAAISTGGYSTAGGTHKYEYNRTCAVTAGGGVKCWGSDVCGLLGDGTTECLNPRASPTPVNVVGLSSGVASVAVGGGSTCALTTDGRVKCWGQALSSPLQPQMTGTIPQTITFGAAPVVPAGGTGTVSATGGASGNPVTFTSLTPAACSISGTTVSGLSSGQMCTIAANQAGNDYYDPAEQATQSFVIGDKQSQTITFGPAPTIVVGGTGAVSATASSGLTVTFASNTPSICSVSGNTVTGIAAGSCTIAADQAGDQLYAPAPEATQTFPVNQTAGTRLLTVSRSGSPGTVSSQPAGIDCGSVCAASFALGSTVTLTSITSGSVLTLWGGACSGFGPCAVTMDIPRSVTATFIAYTGELKTRYRLYNPTTFEHLYTTDQNEYNVLPSCCGWTPEGAIYRVFGGAGSYGGTNALPYYRLYNPFSHQHHWTVDAYENNYLASIGWTQEGTDGYILTSPAQGAVPLYRLFLNAQGGLHLWTIDVNERNYLVQNAGWVDEGIAGYVIPLP